MTAVIVVVLFIAIILLGMLAWGLCAAASDAEEQEDEAYGKTEELQRSDDPLL